MDQWTTFILKFVVTAVIAAALSLALRADPMNALAQGSDQVVHARAPAAMQPSLRGDREFAEVIIANHQRAIDIAKTVLEHGDDAETRALAEQVIADEEEKIAETRAWLARRGARAASRS